jgi:hypothetical protein
LLPSANLPVSDLIKFPLCNPFYCSISIFWSWVLSLKFSESNVRKWARGQKYSIKSAVLKRKGACENRTGDLPIIENRNLAESLSLQRTWGPSGRYRVLQRHWVNQSSVPR